MNNDSWARTNQEMWLSFIPVFICPKTCYEVTTTHPTLLFSSRKGKDVRAKWNKFWRGVWEAGEMVCF